MKFLAWYSAVVTSIAILIGFINAISKPISDTVVAGLIAFIPVIGYLWLMILRRQI